MRIMHVFTRARPLTKFLVLFCAFVLLFMSLLSNVSLLPVSAKKNEKITQLIMVGNGNVEQMKSAVETQYLHQGDVSQHAWVYKTFDDLDTVIDYVSSVREEAEKQAIVLWIGEEYLDSKIETFHCADGKPTEGNAFDADGDGKPTDKIEDTDPVTVPDGTVIEAGAAKYNATSLGRAINGYDYDVEYWVPEFDAAGNEVGQHLETKTEHAKGYGEVWKETGVKFYVASLGPVSKAAGNGNNGKLDVVGDVPDNIPTKSFNKAFSSALGGQKFLDVYDLILDHVPYYRDGTKGGLNSEYDDHTLQFIFHMLWNTVLLDNPNDEPPEPIDVSFYSIASSLTAYMNDVLGTNADEDHSEHKLIEATTGVGDAGAFLGYGDEKDFGFKSYITGVLSKTSSVIDYSALVELEDDGSNNLYWYSRYGRLLADMGLDSTGTAVSGVGTRVIPGAFCMLFYVLSAGLNLGFSEMMNLLRLFNPFQFFRRAHTIASSLRVEMSAGGFTQVKHIGGRLLNYIGDLYDIFRNLGAFTILPLLLAVIIIRILFNRNYTDPVYRTKNGYEKEDFSAMALFYKFFMRAMFIMCGIPLLGVTYTAALDNICNIVSTTDCASTEIVASSFVDFSEWAKQYRLGPIVGGTFISEDAGTSGQADEKTYKNLRSTAFAINKATGAAKNIDISGFGADSLTDVNKWNENVLQVNDGTSWDGSWETAVHKYQSDTASMKEALSLLITWMRGSFYHSSDWESDTMAVFTDEHKDLVGRRAGLDEQDPPSNENLAYEMFEQTTTTDKWAGRKSDDNLSIFKGEPMADSGKFDWGEFNIFANGTLEAANSGGKIIYSDGHAVKDSCGTPNGLCPGSKIGLSTMSLYNYLTTDFQPNQMVIYSQRQATSTHTSTSHYSVNLIGTGAHHFMYYLSMVVVMMVVGIIGIYYACGMVWDNVKRSFDLLTAIPGAMLGVLRSVVNVIVIVVMMVFELFVTVVLYEVLSDFLAILLTITEDPLDEAGITVTALPGLLAKIGLDRHVDLGVNSIWIHMLIFSILALLVGFILFKSAKAFRRVVNILFELSLRWLIPYKSIWDRYDGVCFDQKPVSETKLGFCLAFREVLSL